MFTLKNPSFHFQNYYLLFFRLPISCNAYTIFVVVITLLHGQKINQIFEGCDRMCGTTIALQVHLLWKEPEMPYQIHL
jgi:hypothetical protein